MAVGHRPGWPSWESSRDTSPLTLQPPRPFKARDPVLMPGDPRLGIVLSGPQAPWGSPSPRCAMSGRFHLRQPRRPRSPHATACASAARGPADRCRSGRTHEPRRAERRFRAGRRPRQVWSWSGRYGGYQARDQRPPATFRAGGAATYRRVHGRPPSPRLQNPPNGVGGRPPLVRRTPRRPRDRRVRCCRYRRPATQPRTTDHPQGLRQRGRKWHVPGRVPWEFQEVGARTAHSLDAG